MLAIEENGVEKEKAVPSCCLPVVRIKQIKCRRSSAASLPLLHPC